MIIVPKLPRGNDNGDKGSINDGVVSKGNHNYFVHTREEKKK
jgi:hypothetical protein